jgi:hypothetical protein
LKGNEQEYMQRTVTVHEDYQTGYTYACTAPVGQQFDEAFAPDMSPKEMLAAGIFGGAYFLSIPQEFPRDWFAGVVFSKTGKPDKTLNYFGVNASQPREEWQRKGWIHEDDPLGWFLWYCRYYMSRRHADDARQIQRWRNYRRHLAQVAQNCEPSDEHCRPKQRQSLLHWAYDIRSKSPR